MSDMTRPGPPWRRPHGFLSDDERKNLEARVARRKLEENRPWTCEICGFEIMPGYERRWNSRTVIAHLDCVIDYSEHLDEEHR